MEQPLQKSTKVGLESFFSSSRSSLQHMADYDIDIKQLRRSQHMHGRLPHFGTHSRGAPLSALRAPKGCEPVPLPRDGGDVWHDEPASRPTRGAQHDARQRMHAARHSHSSDRSHSADNNTAADSPATQQFVYVKTRACRRGRDAYGHEETNRIHRRQAVDAW